MRPCVTSIFTTLCENVSCNLARFGKDARMPVSHSLRQQLEKLDQQIVDLLGERVNLCQKALEEDEGVFDDATLGEFVTEWEGMADEQGLHVPSVSGICKLVLKMCKISGE